MKPQTKPMHSIERCRNHRYMKSRSKGRSQDSPQEISKTTYAIKDMALHVQYVMKFLIRPLVFDI